MIPKFKAALFDMDGTLLRSMRYWRLTTLELLMGRNIIPSPEQVSRFYTTSSRALCKEVLAEHGIFMEDMDILRELEGYMYHHYVRDVRMKPRANEFLDKLRREGIPMAVATQAPKNFAVMVLERLGLAHNFEFITDGYVHGMNKRSPDYFRLMAQKLNVETGDMCVFEDALYSIKSAKAAGCPVVGIYDETQRPDWAEIESLADCCIREYEELL